MNLKEGVF